MSWIAFWNYTSEGIKIPGYLEIEEWMHLRKLWLMKLKSFLNIYWNIMIWLI